jgi:hypothetical protein
LGTKIGCATAVGAGLLTGQGFDYTIASAKTFWTGEYATPYGEQALKNAGLTENQAAWTYAGAGVAGGLVTSSIPRIANNIERGAAQSALNSESASYKGAQAAVMEPEANFAGGVPVRPRDGYTPQGTPQTDTSIGQHLIKAEVTTGRNPSISGGHNADNFYDTLKAKNGQIIGTPTQIGDGLVNVKYKLPNGIEQTKTIYDPKVHSDTKMASMANDAVSRAIANFNATGNRIQVVVVDGVTFRVPISKYKGGIYVPSAFPVKPVGGK